MTDMEENKDIKEEQEIKEGSEAVDTEGNAAEAENKAADTGSSKAGADDAAGNDSETDASGAEAKTEASDESEAEGSESSEDGSDEGEAAEGEAESADKPDKKDKQIEELNDKYKRLFAEFDNFRKRSEAEKTGMFAEGERTVLLKVLPLIDNFERALDSISEEQKGTALADGIDKTYKAFMTTLTELGVTAIEAKGKSFDANLHNAVMHVDDDSAEENIVVEEFQKGYMFKDKVLRYSMVKVAN